MPFGMIFTYAGHLYKIIISLTVLMECITSINKILGYTTQEYIRLGTVSRVAPKGGGWHRPPISKVYTVQ